MIKFLVSSSVVQTLLVSGTGTSCSNPDAIAAEVKMWVSDTVHDAPPNIVAMNPVDLIGEVSTEVCDGRSYPISYPLIPFHGVEGASMIKSSGTVDFVYMSTCRVTPEIDEICSCRRESCDKTKKEKMRSADPLLRAYLVSKLVNGAKGHYVRRTFCLSSPSTPMRWLGTNHKIDNKSKSCRDQSGFARGMGIERVGDANLPFKIHTFEQANFAKNSEGIHLRTNDNELYADLNPAKSKELFLNTLTMGKRVLEILNSIHSRGLVLDSMWSNYFVSPMGDYYGVKEGYNELILGNILAVVPLGVEVRKDLNMPSGFIHHNAKWESEDVEITARGYRDDLFDLIELMNEMLSLGKYPRSQVTANWSKRTFFDVSDDRVFSHITYSVGVMKDIQTQLHVFLTHVLGLTEVDAVPAYDVLFGAIDGAIEIIKNS